LGYFGFHESRYDGPGHDCCSYCRNSLVWTKWDTKTKTIKHKYF
jgi:hypothetical protein